MSSEEVPAEEIVEEVEEVEEEVSMSVADALKEVCSVQVGRRAKALCDDLNFMDIQIGISPYKLLFLTPTIGPQKSSYP